MPSSVLFSASMQCAPPLQLHDSAVALAAAPIDMLHIDLMDASFVPNLALNFDQLSALSQLAKIPLDAHLMLRTPDAYLDRTIDAGASFVCLHVESQGDMPSMLRHIRRRGVRAGLAISPHTSIDMLFPLLDLVDYLLVMAVQPGFSGQAFLPQTLSRLDALAPLGIPMMVDGGIDRPSAVSCIRHGATLLVAGAKCIFLPHQDLTETTRAFMRCVRKECTLCPPKPVGH